MCYSSKRSQVWPAVFLEHRMGLAKMSPHCSTSLLFSECFTVPGAMYTPGIAAPPWALKVSDPEAHTSPSPYSSSNIFSSCSLSLWQFLVCSDLYTNASHCLQLSSARNEALGSLLSWLFLIKIDERRQLVALAYLKEKVV